MSVRPRIVLITVVSSLLIAASAWAQSETFFSNLRERVSIRQSLKDKNTINEPAFVTLRVPDEGPDVMVVAAAATVFVKPESANSRFNVGAAVQFNQDSTPSKRQNLFVGGTELEARWGNGNSEEPFYFPRLRGTAGYKQNGDKHSKGMTANAYLTYEKNRPGSDSSSIAVMRDQLEFTPQAGIEFDNTLSATLPTDEGRVTRTLLSTKVNAYPLASRLRERLILSADLSYRYDVQTGFAGSDRQHPFAQFSVTAALDPFRVFSISVDRVIGDDPSQDFDGPAFTRFAFKVQLTKPQKRTIRRLFGTAQRHLI
jgi:hypothetical protein